VSSNGPPAEGPTGIVPLLAAATCAGAGVMSVELAAVRLIAPWYGSSLAVWTNVLGVVLLALSGGYLLGARLARGARPARSLGLVLGVGALATALAPLGAAPLAELFLPQPLVLAEAQRALSWGSLATALCLFLPAATLLGAVGPLAVETVQRRRGAPAGTAGGWVLCVSTLGSLAGTFGTAHWALPELGVRGTFQGAALLLALAAALIFATEGRRAGAALVLLGTVLAGGLHAALGDGRAADPSERLLAERESPYQTVRVVERLDDPAVPRRLEVNERSDSYQSVYAPQPGLLPAGYYYNDFVLPPWWAQGELEPGQRLGPWRLLFLGLGGGTAWRVLSGAAPAGCELRGDGVELDPVVVELARAELGLPAPGGALTVHAGLDARAALRGLPGPYEQVVLDTYANQVELPAHLCTVEFFGELRGCLVPGGWLTINVGAFGLDDPLVEVLAHSVAQGLGAPVLALPVPGARNVTLVARRDAPLPELAAAGPVLGSESVEGLLAPRRLPGGHRRFESGADVLRDDRSPTEVLQLRAWARAQAQSLPDGSRGAAFVRELEPQFRGPADFEAARRASRRYESAGLWHRAYGCSLAGLEGAPADLELLLRASALALTCRRPDLAASHLDALAVALAAADSTGAGRTDEVAAWWGARLAENRAWLAEQRQIAAARSRATARSRGTSLTALVAALGALVVLAWMGRPPRGVRPEFTAVG
jgi:predicted membrane-bound spermidine synthase